MSDQEATNVNQYDEWLTLSKRSRRGIRNAMAGLRYIKTRAWKIATQNL